MNYERIHYNCRRAGMRKMLIKYVEEKFLPSKGRRQVNSQTRIYNDILNAFEGGLTYLSGAIFYYNNGVVCRAWCVSLAPFF